MPRGFHEGKVIISMHFEIYLDVFADRYIIECSHQQTRGSMVTSYFIIHYRMGLGADGRSSLEALLSMSQWTKKSFKVVIFQ